MFLCKGTKSGVNKAVRAGQKKAHILEVELLKMDEEEKKLNINRCDYVTSAAEYYGKTIAYVSIPQKKSKNTFRNLCVTSCNYYRYSFILYNDSAFQNTKIKTV